MFRTTSEFNTPEADNRSVLQIICFAAAQIRHDARKLKLFYRTDKIFPGSLEKRTKLKFSCRTHPHTHILPKSLKRGEGG